MFYINQDEELNAKLLEKMMNQFFMNVQPQLFKYKNYYDGIQEIMNKSYSDTTKPCNKVITNFVKNIADSYCGYIATPGYISYRSDNDIEDIMDILRYNDYQTEDADFLLNALIYGVSAELMYIDNLGKTRFRLINPTTCFGVYDNSLTEDLLYFVRFYPVSMWDDSNRYNVDVYSDSGVAHYKMDGKNSSLTLESEEPHYFSQVPANIFMLQDEKSIFDCILSLQDASNELLSDEIDDYSAFCDAYLGIIGADAEEEDVRTMKENRVLVLPEGADAKWITKSSNDAQVENILKRVQESIYRIASCPDFSSESFTGGVSSGIAIQYKLTGMETRAGKVEAEMKKALQRRIEIICGIASLKVGEEVFRDIDIIFKRNLPVDINSTVNLVNSLQGIVSNSTLLGQLDFIDDVNEEQEKIQKQKEENMAIYGAFPTQDNDEDDEE